MRKALWGLGSSVAVLSIVGCMQRVSSQALESQVAPVNQPTQAELATARGYIQKIDRGCGRNGSCHNSSDESEVPFDVLKKFADQTVAYHAVMEQPIQEGDPSSPNCFTEPLTPEVASVCWSRIMGSGGLGSASDSPFGGLYQGAIKRGLVKKIVTSLPASEAAAAQAQYDEMFPMNTQASSDFTADIPGFRAMATWISSEASSGYRTIKVIRPPIGGDSEGDTMACDTVSPEIQALYRPDFKMKFPAATKGMRGLNPKEGMYGCTNDRDGWPTDASACFGDLPDDSTFVNADVPGLSVKVLRKLNGRPSSSYWTRSSPDGRFVSTGNGRIEDLAVADRSIKVSGDSIDPFWYPDNKFYTWPGMICKAGPLFKSGAGQLDEVGTDVSASSCVNADVGVYGSAGPSGDTGDMVVVQGYTNNNPGSLSSTADATGSARPDSEFRTRVFRGLDIVDEPKTYVTPYETDFQLSPSGKLVVGINTNGARTYKVRMLADPENNNKTAKICLKGEKPNTSFDDRFVSMHHYADGSPQDVGIGEDGRGNANIFVYDLIKKKYVRVTNMVGGRKALFPHWRADGWLYFLIKEPGGLQSVAATNVAFVLADQP